MLYSYLISSMGTRTQSVDSTKVALPKKYLILLLLMLASLSGYIIYREIDIRGTLELGEFYKNYVKGYELSQEWKMTSEELRREKKIIDRLLIERGNHKITREQLGRQSWGFLHMITTTAPQILTPEFKEQFNAFLLLFTKLYPCKYCSNKFIRTLKKVGEFKGESRTQLMDYMCMLHNRVNKRLKKSIFDCDIVTAEWGTCDCFSENPINNIKR